MIKLLPALLLLLACHKPEPPPSSAPKEKEPPPVAQKQEPDAAAAPLVLETKSIIVKSSMDEVPVKARVPMGWTRQGDNTFVKPSSFGETHLEFTATCDGACTPEKLPATLAALVKAAPVRAEKPNLNTGDPALDAVRMDIKVLEEGDLPGGHFVAYRQSRPPGLDAPSTMDTFRGLCARHKEGADVFVYAQVRAPFSSEKDVWPLVMEACKTWELE